MKSASSRSARRSQLYSATRIARRRSRAAAAQRRVGRKARDAGGQRAGIARRDEHGIDVVDEYFAD